MFFERIISCVIFTQIELPFCSFYVGAVQNDNGHLDMDYDNAELLLSPLPFSYRRQCDQADDIGYIENISRDDTKQTYTVYYRCPTTVEFETKTDNYNYDFDEYTNTDGYYHPGGDNENPVFSIGCDEYEDYDEIKVQAKINGEFRLVSVTIPTNPDAPTTGIDYDLIQLFFLANGKKYIQIPNQQDIIIDFNFSKPVDIQNFQSDYLQIDNLKPRTIDDIFLSHFLSGCYWQ